MLEDLSPVGDSIEVWFDSLASSKISWKLVDDVAQDFNARNDGSSSLLLEVSHELIDFSCKDWCVVEAVTDMGEFVLLDQSSQESLNKLFNSHYINMWNWWKMWVWEMWVREMRKMWKMESKHLWLVNSTLVHISNVEAVLLHLWVLVHVVGVMMHVMVHMWVMVMHVVVHVWVMVLHVLG